MESNELQSRREFFKSAAKKSLPLLGVIVGLNLLTSCEDDDGYYYDDNGDGESSSGCSGCSGGCRGDCRTTCYGSSCGSTCRTVCTKGCSDVCTTSCKGTFLKISDHNNGTTSNA